MPSWAGWRRAAQHFILAMPRCLTCFAAAGASCGATCRWREGGRFFSGGRLTITAGRSSAGGKDVVSMRAGVAYSAKACRLYAMLSWNAGAGYGDGGGEELQTLCLLGARHCAAFARASARAARVRRSGVFFCTISGRGATARAFACCRASVWRGRCTGRKRIGTGRRKTFGGVASPL